MLSEPPDAKIGSTFQVVTRQISTVCPLPGPTWPLSGLTADDISQKGAEATVAAEGVALPEFTLSEFR